MGRRIRVAVRIRPGEGGELCVRTSSGSGTSGSGGHNGGSGVTVADPSGRHASSIPRDFHVDRIIPQDWTNAELFRSLVLERIRSSVDEPDTSCFLAYGHTSSGKTHTIAGAGAEPGLLSLAARAVLDAHGVAEVAMLEVYGEAVHDLLAHGERRVVRRRCGPDGPVIVVEHLTTCSLTTMEEWEAVAEFGMQTRRTAPTERNARSSRSHAIFTIKSSGFRLCLVDLAGSERQTVFSPQLNKESIAINKSLSRLSTVLEALSTARRRADGSASYVNFRDTTLTVLLERYLSGASMTTFLACIHPDTQFYHETLSTMRYTQRLKRISTRAAPRQASEDMSLFRPAEHGGLLAELVRLRRIVEQQEQEKQKHENLHRVLHMSPPTSSSSPHAARADYECAGEHTPLHENRNVAERSPRALRQRQRQRLLRSKDTKRVAGWLLSRILGALPELSVGFDDYFDAYLPPLVQVVGYVSLMAHLPPRSPGEAVGQLALLDVGDIAMGLSMLDAGIPACVGLHRLQCRASDAWEAHEYDEANRVFVLAVFEVNDALVEPMDGSLGAFECCGGLLALEPLVPLAIVLCTPADAPDALKESILQHLVTLQGEQDGAAQGPTPGSHSAVGDEGSGGQLEDTEEEEEEEEDTEDIEEEEEEDIEENALAREIERQSHDKALICSPFRALPPADSHTQSLHRNMRRFVLSPSPPSPPSPPSSPSSASSSYSEESVPEPSGKKDTTAAAAAHHPPQVLTDIVQSSRIIDGASESSEDIGTPEDIDISADHNEEENHGEGASGSRILIHTEKSSGTGIQNGRIHDKAGSSTRASADRSDGDRSRCRAMLFPDDVHISVPEHPSTPVQQQQQQEQEQQEEQQLPHWQSGGHAFVARRPVAEQIEPRVGKRRREKNRKRLVMAKGCHSCAML